MQGRKGLLAGGATRSRPHICQDRQHTWGSSDQRNAIRILRHHRAHWWCAGMPEEMVSVYRAIKRNYALVAVGAHLAEAVSNFHCFNTTWPPEQHRELPTVRCHPWCAGPAPPCRRWRPADMHLMFRVSKGHCIKSWHKGNKQVVALVCCDLHTMQPSVCQLDLCTGPFPGARMKRSLAACAAAAHAAACADGARLVAPAAVRVRLQPWRRNGADPGTALPAAGGANKHPPTARGHCKMQAELLLSKEGRACEDIGRCLACEKRLVACDDRSHKTQQAAALGGAGYSTG